MTEIDGKLVVHTCHTIYKKADGFVGNSYIVKATDEYSYIIWNESNQDDDMVIRIARINNSNGNIEYCSKSIFGTLSDCKPMYVDGNLIWYVTDEYSFPKFYKLNTSNLDKYTWIKSSKKQK